MSDIRNEQAFPCMADGWTRNDAPGMTLRDYFAAAELQKVDGASVCDHPSAYERLADHCYRMADAMLRERAK